jgi:hypothetical protein
VLATVYLGQLVPSRTGRETWLGHPSWTPDYAARGAAATELLSGRLPPARAEALVRRSGARFVLARCGERANLAGAAKRVRRFGCATVYEL